MRFKRTVGGRGNSDNSVIRGIFNSLNDRGRRQIYHLPRPKKTMMLFTDVLVVSLKVGTPERVSRWVPKTLQGWWGGAKGTNVLTIHRTESVFPSYHPPLPVVVQFTYSTSREHYAKPSLFGQTIRISLGRTHRRTQNNNIHFTPFRTNTPRRPTSESESNSATGWLIILRSGTSHFHPPPHSYPLTNLPPQGSGRIFDTSIRWQN